VKCIATNGGQTLTSHELEIIVAGSELVQPIINSITLGGNNPFNTGANLNVQASLNTTNVSVNWEITGGTLENTSGFAPTWKLPNQEGIYKITLTVSNILGTASSTKDVLIKDLGNTSIDYTPVIYYNFNGNTKNGAQNAYDAVLAGGTLTADQRGYANSAYNFSSSSQYTYTPNDAALNFGDKLTVSLWVKPDQLSGSEQFLISHGSWEERYKMSVTPEKKVRWTVNTTSGIVDVDDNQPLEAGQFTHYTGLFSGYSAELYRNGVLVSFQPLSGTVRTSSKSITVARKDQTTSEYTFKGTIDEVRIYNSALNTAFISKLPNLWELHSGIESIETEAIINIYPNPFSASFNINLPDNEILASLEICDLNGKPLWKQAVLNNVQNFSPVLIRGIYLLKVQALSGKTYFSKLIKQ
jgi:hypothetical protein